MSFPVSVDVSSHDEPTVAIGIVVRVHKWKLVIPLMDVQEITTCPALTSVPWAKPWMMGVAHICGIVVPITDLRLFMTGQAHIRSSSGQPESLVVFADADWRYGLLVSEVIGMRPLGQILAVTDDVEDSAFAEHPSIGSCITGKIQQDDGSQWLIFRPHKLLENEQFMSAIERKTTFSQVVA